MTGSAPPPGPSVVVASFRAPALLAACLDSLQAARTRVPAHVFVARRGEGGDVAHLFAERPWATLVPAPADADVPRLRGVGMASAAPGWLAITEDHCTVHPRWLERLQKAMGSGANVIGGGMGNARPRALDWGAFFAEYGFFSSVRPHGTGIPLLTGANVAYGPNVAPQVVRWALEGAWEDVIHQRLAAAGATLRFEPAARVLQNASYRFGAFCRDRYEHGVAYARVRLAENPDTSRGLRLASTVLLPGVLAGRVARAAAGEDRGAFVRAFPFTLAFLTAWACGEAVGYLRGSAR